MEYKRADIEQPLLVKKEEDTPQSEEVDCLSTEAEIQRKIDVWLYGFTNQLLQTRWLWWYWRTISFKPDPRFGAFDHVELEPRIKAYFIKSIRLAFKPHQHLLKSLRFNVVCSRENVDLGIIVYLTDGTWYDPCLGPFKWLIESGTTCD